MQATAQAELIAPGKNKLTVVYKGKTYTAGLGRTGNILFNGAPRAGGCIWPCMSQPIKRGDGGGGRPAVTPIGRFVAILAFRWIGRQTGLA